MDRRRFLALAGGLFGFSRAAQALSAPPLHRLRLFNAHTKETFYGPYRDDLGRIELAVEELSLETGTARRCCRCAPAHKTSAGIGRPAHTRGHRTAFPCRSHAAHGVR